MTRLLNANFARLFKGKLFWLCAAAAIIFGVIEIPGDASKANQYDFILHPEASLFNMSGFVLLIITAVLVGIFVGSEHSGVLRNKIIAGKKRVSVYFADLIACSAGIAIIHILFIAAVLITGILFGGRLLMTAADIISFELLQLASLLSVCAFFTAITMLIPQKLAGAIAALVLIFASFFVNNSIPGKLWELEKTVKEEIDGIIIDTGKRPDGKELTDSELAEINFLKTMQDILPFGHFDQIRSGFHNAIAVKDGESEGYNFEKQPYHIEIIYFSLGIIAASTIVGTLVFRKKDLR